MEKKINIDIYFENKMEKGNRSPLRFKDEDCLGYFGLAIEYKDSTFKERKLTFRCEVSDDYEVELINVGSSLSQRKLLDEYS